MHSDSGPAQGWGRLEAPAHWRSIDFIADLHLQAGEPATAALWRDWLRRSDADALFILGDLFEVWIGDDLLAADPQTDPEFPFLSDCCATLREFAATRALYVLRGNRDFLLGAGFAAASGATLLDDPTLLHWGEQRLLLSHGDAWCLDDRDYLDFRAQVRSPAWQAAFLARPLTERCAIARALRARSEARKQEAQMNWADVDHASAAGWLSASGATTLVHGHTHRPGRHDLGAGLQRLVLSDWDAGANPPRAEVLRLQRPGDWNRLAPLA